MNIYGCLEKKKLISQSILRLVFILYWNKTKQKKASQEFWNTVYNSYDAWNTKHHWALHVCKVHASALKKVSQSQSFDDLFPSSEFLFRPEIQFFVSMTFSWKEKLRILTCLCTISLRSHHISSVNRGRYVASTVIQWTLQEFCIKLILRDSIDYGHSTVCLWRTISEAKNQCY